jgi:hypothetical protein
LRVEVLVQQKDPEMLAAVVEQADLDLLVLV